jgi:HAD superfamily hydrolase (TIGR01509 family)
MTVVPIRAVLFDFAGTLFSDRALRDIHLAQLRFVADACAVEIDDAALRAAYRRGIGIAARALMARPCYSHRELFASAFREMAVALGASIDDATANEAVDRQYQATTEHAALRLDVRSTLEGLRARGIHTQIVSNIDDEQLQPMVRRLGLDALLDAWTSSDEAGSCKPDAQIFAYALAKAGCDARAALFVGDTVAHDVVGPAAVGMATAWLLADVEPKDDAGHPADYEIAALREVLAIVDARTAERVAGGVA